MEDMTRLLGGRHALPGGNPQGVRMDLIKEAGVTSKSHMQSSSHISKQTLPLVKAVITHLLKHDHKDRPLASVVRNSPWLFSARPIHHDE